MVIVGATVYCILGSTLSVTIAASETPTSIVPGQTDDRLLYASDKWSVWRRSVPIENTRTFRHAYYLQRLNEEKAKIFHTEVRRGGVPAALAVTTDGNIAIAARGKVTWYSVGDVTQPTPSKSLTFVRGVYPDGVLVQTLGKFSKPPPPVAFIPFRGRGLNEKASIEVVPAGVRTFYGNTIYSSDIARHKNVFAWSTANAIHYFDAASGKRWQVEPSFSYSPRWVTAFDGETVVTRNHFAFDARTGEFLGEEDLSKRWNHITQPIFAVRHRIGYWVKDGQLRATDLTSCPIRTTSLR